MEFVDLPTYSEITKNSKFENLDESHTQTDIEFNKFPMKSIVHRSHADQQENDQSSCLSENDDFIENAGLESRKRCLNDSFRNLNKNVISNSENFVINIIGEVGFCNHSFSINENNLDSSNETEALDSIKNRNVTINNTIAGNNSSIQINNEIPAPTYENVNNCSDVYKADLINELPSYRSLSIEILKDEPPRYEVITGKELLTKLGSTDETSRRPIIESRRRKIFKRITTIVLLFIIMVCIVVIFFAFGKRIGKNDAMEHKASKLPGEVGH